MKFLKPALWLCLLALIVPAFASAEGEGGKRHPSYTMTGRDNLAPDSPLNPNFVVAEEQKLSEGGFWRSAFIPESLVGLAVGDIDRGGDNKIIYASARNVYVGRVQGKKLEQLAKYTVPATEKIISIDIMDLTGDGRMEIICSAQNDKNTAFSMILSYSGAELTPLATGIPWYLRVIGAPEGRFLAGQKPAASNNVSHVYSGKAMRLSFDGSKVKAGGAVGLPPFVDLYNFTLARLGGSGTQLVAAVKFPSEHIILYEGENRAWESKEEYGGTMNYIESGPPGRDGVRREYLPSRILIADIDQDGQNELIVAKNDRGGVPFMSKQRAFSGGVMQAFKYANMSLSPFFRTRSLPGPAVDYALADFNNDGTLDLVAAVVTEQKSGMWKEGRSVIIAYEIGQKQN